MKWTKQPPTEDGYYWLRLSAYDGEPCIASIVSLEMDGVADPPLLEFVGSEEPQRLYAFSKQTPEAEWSGPLQPPAFECSRIHIGSTDGTDVDAQAASAQATQPLVS